MKDDVNELLKLSNKIATENILVIVEGKKDRAALETFGIENIVELSKKPLFEIIETVAEKTKKCVILTDLDRKGRELYGKLNRGLSERGVYIDNTLRHYLFKNTKIRQIEGLKKVQRFLN